MSSEILDGLAGQDGCEIVRKADLDAFLARNPRALVFLAGDTRQRPEGLDVAVVVRELLAVGSSHSVPGTRTPPGRGCACYTACTRV